MKQAPAGGGQGPQIEQDHSEILIGDDAGPQPVDQESPILKARQDALDLILLALIPEPPHGPRDGHRVIVEGLDDHGRIEPALAISLVGLGLSYDLFGVSATGSGS
jgi:hypothetical protein